MDCARIDLIAYHFGTQEEKERDAAEEHLLGCTRCLASYLALKRASERREGSPGGRGVSPDENDGAERPSDEVRARLRQDVARTFPQPARWRPFGWLARPIPLYQGLAAATFALVVAVFAQRAHSRSPSSPAWGLHGGEQVDTSRPSAESLTIY